jgi:hypothetical protein
MTTHSFSFEAPIWLWQGDAPAAWHFITVPSHVADEIKFFAGSKRGFGSVGVTVKIGASRWATSLFPDTKSGSYLLPVKASVRKAESIRVGDNVKVSLDVKSDF